MAHIEVSDDARAHILQRIRERGKNLPLGLTPQAVLDACVDAVKTQAPDDWRFTRQPNAHFFFSYLNNTGDRSTHIKFLGGTHRQTERGRVIVAELETLALSPRGESDWETFSGSLESIAEQYLEDLADPDATVVHTLKTVMNPKEPLRQSSLEKQNLFASYRHTGLLRACKAPRNLALRPNALFLPRSPDDSAVDLWVRQGDSYLAFSASLNINRRSHCVFRRLTAVGVAPDQGALWSFDEQGNAKFVASVECGQPTAVRKEDLPEGFHGETYWTLPTALDSLWLNLDYELREQFPIMTAERMVLARLVDSVYELAWALAEVPGASEPAWFRKKGL